MKKVLILAPHPDDEIVGTCIIIKKFLDRKHDVSIFFLTHGVISKQEMWFFDRYKYEYSVKRRLKEAKKTLNELGIKKTFYQKIPSRTLKSNLQKSFYKLQRILKKYNFDYLFTPAYEGGHQDHDIANFLSSLFKQKIKVFEYSEYNFFKNKVNSNSFPNINGSEITFNLTLDEVSFKKKLLNNYISEKKNLTYLKFDYESYRPLEKYDYSLPPHEGILFYRRFSFFSWHPRVDSTRPLNVCKLLTEFKKKNDNKTF